MTLKGKETKKIFNKNKYIIINITYFTFSLLKIHKSLIKYFSRNIKDTKKTPNNTVLQNENILKLLIFNQEKYICLEK